MVTFCDKMSIHTILLTKSTRIFFGILTINWSAGTDPRWNQTQCSIPKHHHFPYANGIPTPPGCAVNLVNIPCGTLEWGKRLHLHGCRCRMRQERLLHWELLILKRRRYQKTWKPDPKCAAESPPPLQTDVHINRKRWLKVLPNTFIYLHIYI